MGPRPEVVKDFKRIGFNACPLPPTLKSPTPLKKSGLEARPKWVDGAILPPNSMVSINKPAYEVTVSWGLLTALMIVALSTLAFSLWRLEFFVAYSIILGLYVVILVTLIRDNLLARRVVLSKGERCPVHPENRIFDLCARCGQPRCTLGLIRIRHRGFSPTGIFGFTGVICKDCANRRVRRLQYALPCVAMLIMGALLFNQLPLLIIFPENIFFFIPYWLGFSGLIAALLIWAQVSWRRYAARESLGQWKKGF